MSARWVCALFIALTSVAHADDRVLASSEIVGFRLRDCRESQCLTVSAAKAEVARTQTSLSALNATLVLESTKEKIACAILRYDLKTQFLMCDNRENGRGSVSVSREFVVQRFAVR